MKLANLDKINTLVTTLSQLDRIALELKNGTVVQTLWHRDAERSLSIASTIGEATVIELIEVLQKSIRAQGAACLDGLKELGVEVEPS